MTARRFVITGGTKGIGRAASERLAAWGHEVVAMARKPEPTFPGTVVEVDLADRSATADAIGRVLDSGPVDGLINNVGLVRPAWLGHVELGDLDAVYDLNVRTAVQLAQEVTPGMRSRSWGRIVNVTSLVALGAVQRTAYAAAKAALDGLVRSWALEVAADGVTVNGVAPGPTETELFRAGNPPGSESEARYFAMIPVKRLGRPEELGAAIAFLCSEDAGFITGQVLHVDGGASVGRS